MFGYVMMLRVNARRTYPYDINKCMYKLFDSIVVTNFICKESMVYFANFPAFFVAKYNNQVRT